MGCATFYGVVDGLTRLILRVEINVNVGIHPLDFSYLAGEFDRFVVIVFGRKRVMCYEWNRGQHHAYAYTSDRKQTTFHVLLSRRSLFPNVPPIIRGCWSY